MATATWPNQIYRSSLKDKKKTKKKQNRQAREEDVAYGNACIFLVFAVCYLGRKKSITPITNMTAHKYEKKQVFHVLN